MKVIKISVIMSVYNETIEHLKLSIDSILKQSFKEFEFIIILDNPKAKNLEDLIVTYSKNDSRIVYIKNNENIWLASSLNKWIIVSKWKYIARMDADDISNEDRLEIQFNYMENNNDIDLLFSWVNYIDNKWHYIKSFCPKKEIIINIKKHFFKWHYLVHPTLFCKKEILSQNMYNPLFMRTQDYELRLRIISKYKFDIIEYNLLEYRIPDESDINSRINKIKKSTYWAIKALNTNIKIHILNLFFWIFYLKILVMYLTIRMPKKIINFIILINDKLWK